MSDPIFSSPLIKSFELTNVEGVEAPTPAGVTLSAELIQVTEGGATGTYTVVLDSAPTANVTITLNPGNQLTVNQGTLTFTPANFNIAQTVTVTAIDDPVGEGPHRGVISATVTSSDANYNGITVANVVAQITDNDIPQQDPTFQPATTNPFVGSFAKPTLTDIDGDGDLDALIGNQDGNTVFYRNTGSAGSPAFAAPETNPFGLTSVGVKAAPTFADIDGDGDLDAFVGNDSGDTLLYRNTGSAAAPLFAAPTTNPFGLNNVWRAAAPTFADIDGDGDLDAFVGNSDGNTRFYQNTGSASSPLFAAPTFRFADVGSFAAPTFADIDGDGDLDAFIGDKNGNTVFYRNTGSAGSPAFGAPVINPFGLTDVGYFAAPTFADIDGDGDLDAFVGNGYGNTVFFLNGLPPTPPGVTLSAELIQVAEGGMMAATYTVVLDSAPTDDVTITLNPGNQLSVNTPTLTFTPANFNIAQTVTVTAIDDPVGEGPHRGAISATVTSSDANYNGVTVGNVVAQISDNDIPQQDPTFQTATVNPFGLTDVSFRATPTFADIDGD
ncbi:MAG: FG-GAP-like repeat-containing protein, partial [Cyanobacteriota bacterium]|nr:FG-GAP-like repeat-containing protein [Cyanobacteriota bacterium]